MKKLLSNAIGFLILVFISGTLFAGIEVSFNPNPVVAGESATISIQSTEGRAKIEELPNIQNLTWSPFDENSRESLFINGKSFEVTSYGFTVSKAGTITIPPLKIKTDSSTSTTKPFEINVTTGALTDLDKYLFLEPKYGINAEKVYVGQEIPLSIYLYQVSQMSIKPLDYPSIKMDNVMLGTFDEINKQNGSFAPYPYGRLARINKNAIEYDRSCFYTTITPLRQGELQGSISIPMDITIPEKNTNKRNSVLNDDFFSNSFFGGNPFSRNKHVTKLISVDLPLLKVLDLPKVPDGINFLGLFGNWNISYNELPKKAKEGDTLTLEIKLTGYGSLQSLKAPQLNLPGFSTYTPEVQKNDNTTDPSQKANATITYLLIPTSTGEKEINLNFAVFDPVGGKYIDSDFKTSVKVEPNPLQQSQSYSVSAQDDKGNSVNLEHKHQPIESILYLKRDISNYVKIPLINNNLFLIIFFLILGPIILVIVELKNNKHKKINNTENSRRRHNATKIKARILSRMMKSNECEFVNIVNDDILKLIADLSGLPPSSTPKEIENALNDKELASALDRVVSARYSRQQLDTKELKHKIYRALKKYRFLFIFSTLCFIYHPSAKAAEFNNNEVMKLYNAEHFDKAIKLYEENINLVLPSPSLYYNIGNCYYMKNDLTKAELYYIRALLLKPRDPETIQNLNFILKKLQLPLLCQINTPKEIILYLRDSFRPDEWLLFASIMVLLIFITIAVRRKINKASFLTGLLIFFILTFISILAYSSLIDTLYSKSLAIVLKTDVQLHSLPSNDSDLLKIYVKPGEKVKILDLSNGWVLIRIDKNNGWVPEESIEKIWKYN